MVIFRFLWGQGRGGNGKPADSLACGAGLETRRRTGVLPHSDVRDSVGVLGEKS